MKRGDGLTSEDITRLGRKLFGEETLDEKGVYYPESSDEFEMIDEELVRELKAAVRERDQKIAKLEAELARLPEQTTKQRVKRKT
jgi:hypothetical protein